MTDRELLEAAAKAAGFDIKSLWTVERGFVKNAWNPLTDDGDALCLAVKLGIGFIHHKGWGQTFHPGLDGRMDYDYGGDPCAATRRAIVRAAAAIGSKQ